MFKTTPQRKIQAVLSLNHLKVAIIIDCFEIFIERPSNLQVRAYTWSNYKHKNTAKVLVGIIPQGTVGFVSEAWGVESLTSI